MRVKSAGVVVLQSLSLVNGMACHELLLPRGEVKIRLLLPKCRHGEDSRDRARLAGVFFLHNGVMEAEDESDLLPVRYRLVVRLEEEFPYDGVSPMVVSWVCWRLMRRSVEKGRDLGKVV